MSYGLSIYYVNLDTLRSAIGSRDESLLEEIQAEFQQRFDMKDEWFDSEIQEGAPTHYEAVRAIIHGGPFDTAYGFLYGYAYETICAFYGQRLDSNWFSPFRSDWLETVDEGLAKLGIDVRVTDFMAGGVPSPLPVSDLPGYGEWSSKQCDQAYAKWSETTSEQHKILDPSVLAAIKQCMVNWAQMVANRGTWFAWEQPDDGYGIAGFCA
uniref:DUF7691 family protein n=1 Tax=Nonomuraea bangladeshensis TaxID=404385 RepID=UPI003F49091A